MSDLAFVEVNGVRITEWVTYSIDSDLLTPADGFSFQIEVPGDRDARRRLLDATRPGNELRVYVGDDVGEGAPRSRYIQMIGLIEDREISGTREEGTTISIEGRDLASYLVDSSVEPTLDVSADMRLVDLVTAAVEPYDIAVVTDSYAAQRTLQGGQGSPDEAARRAGVPPRSYSLAQQEEATRTGRPVDSPLGTDEELQESLFTATGDRLDATVLALQTRRAARSGYANVMGPGDIERLAIKDARPQIGETVWAFIERHCTRLGVLMWMSPLGRLILSSPQYSQRPRYRAVRRYEDDPEDPTNILEAKLHESIGDRHSKVAVYGRGNVRSSERQPVRGEAVDDAWPADLPKPLYLQETDIRTGDAAARKALRELMRHKRDAFAFDITLPDHGANGYLYAVDSTIAIVDEVTGVEGTFYITKRTFKKSREGGTSTSIRAVPLRSLVY